MRNIKGKRSRKRYFLRQKIYGLLAIATSFVLFWVGSGSKLSMDCEGTAALLMLGVGVYLIFAKRIMIL